MNHSTVTLFAMLIFCESFSCLGTAQDKSSFRSDATSNESPKDSAQAQDADDAKKPEPISFKVADGRLEMTAPGDWKKIDPAVTMIEAEFSIEPVEGESKTSRLTVMGAGGSIEANIDRWLGQVQQPDGKLSRDKATITAKEVGGYKIHLLDVSGTYMDQRGPQAPKVELKDHRLLAVIIETDSLGNYFVKLYGPEKTIAKHKEAFVKMIEEAKLVE